MTTMDTTNPLASLPDDDLLAYRRVRDHVRGGRPLAELPDADLLAYRRVRDAASGKPPRNVMGDLLGFTPPGGAVPVPTSRPVGGYAIPDGVQTAGADARGQVPNPGGYGATDRPGSVPTDLDMLGGFARGPGVLAEQAAGLLAGAQADTRLPWDRQPVPPEKTIPGALRASLDRFMPPPQTFPGKVAEQALPLAAGIAGSTVASPALVAGAQGYGGAMAGAMQRGLTPAQAQQEAIASGVTGAVVGSLPLGRFAQRAAGGNPAGGLVGDVALQTAAGTAQAGLDAAAASWIEQNPEQWAAFKAGMGETAALNAVLGLVGHGFSFAAGRAGPPGAQPGGAADGAGSTLPPGETSPRTAPTPDQVQTRAAEAPPANEPPPPARQPAAAETPNPAAQELPREVRQEEGRQEGLLTQQAPAPPGVLTPGEAGAVRPDAAPVRSTDTIPNGSYVTDPNGQRFTAGATLDNGKVVLRREDGRAVRLTAGEMEARGWRRPPLPERPGEQGGSPEGGPKPLPSEPPAPRETAPETAPRPRVGAEESAVVPAAERVSSPSPDSTGRVGPPPAEVANPPGMPKGEANPSESPKSSPRPEKSPPATSEVVPVEPPGADAPGYLDRLITWAETKSREGRTPRPADRPGTRFGGTRVNVYDVIAAAAKVVRGGVRTAAKVRDTVRELLGRDDPETARAAWRLVKGAQTKEGAHDDGRFEMAVGDLLAEDTQRQAVKARIRDLTGQTKPEPEVSQRDALAGQLAAEEKGAARVEKTRAAQEKRDARRLQTAVGLERGAGEQSAAIREQMAKRDAEAKAEVKRSAAAEKAVAERQAMREDFADQLDTLKAKGAVGQDIREALAQAARRYLDPTDLPKVLTYIAKAKALEPRTVTRPDGTTVTEPVSRQWYEGLRKILDIADQSSAKKARAALLAGVGGPERPKSAPKLAARINKLIGVLPEKVDLTRGVVDPEKMAPANRDAAKPIVKDLRRGFTTRANLETLADHLQAKVDAGLSGWADPTKLADLKAIGTKPLSELSGEQAQLLHDALHHLDFLNKTERSVTVMGKALDREKVNGDIVQGLESRFTKDTLDDSEVGSARLILRQLRRFAGEQFRGFGHLVGVAFGKDGAAYDLFYRNPHRGESKADASAEDARDAIRKVAIEQGVDNAALEKMRTKRETVKLPGGSVIDLTPAERMDIAGLWSDPQNRPLMLENGIKYRREKGILNRTRKLATDDYEAITAAMTPAEKAILAEYKKQTNGRLREEMNAASVRIDGFEIATNPDHYSRSVDTSESQKNVKGMGFNMRRWLEDMGILQERTKHKRPILVRDFFDFSDRHLSEMTRYAHMAEPIRDALMALGNPEVSSAMRRKFGERFIQSMMDHYEYVSGTGRHSGGADQSLLRRFTGAAGTAILTARPTSALLQNVGFLTASGDAANPAEAWRIGRHVADPRWADDAAYQDMIAHSGALRVRHEHGATKLIDFTRGEKAAGIGSRITEGVVAKGLYPMSARDKAVSVATFKEIRETVRGDHPDWSPDKVNEEAAIRTEEIIGRTQNPSQRMDRSQMDVDADSNALKAAWLMFTSAGVRAGNVVQSRVYEAAKNATPQNKKMAAWAVATTVLGAAVAESIREFWRRAKHGFQDEQFPREAADHATNISADLANNYVPGAGDIIRGIVAPLRGKPITHDKGGPAEAAVSAVNKMMDLGTYLLSDNEDQKDKAWKRLTASGSTLAPLDIVRGVKAAITGPEPAGWSVVAALQRGDYKTAVSRGRAYIQAHAKDGDLEKARASLQASILARLNRDVPKDDEDTREANLQTARDLASDAMP